MPKECRRLAEVDFPIAQVSRHSIREKSIRHGHPSTLHLWWARRPLAACRAMLLALLWPDPCDPVCPEGFKEQARKLLPPVQGPVPAGDAELRRALLRFIGDFADWHLSTSRQYIDLARALVKAAYGDEPPLVADPFAGGGSIPLEALRLGCDAFATDLNPVAVLILKVMLEIVPRSDDGLADQLRRVGATVKRHTERQLGDLYPTDPDGGIPVAYLWARTVRCESPKCGAEIPLVRSFWLSRKRRRERALRTSVVRRDGEEPRVELEIIEPKADRDVDPGTVRRARATCPCCGTVLRAERVRAQLASQHGGADVVFDATGRRVGGARLLAVVTLKPGEQGRHYRLPSDRDYAAVRAAHERLCAILDEWERGGKRGICPVPDEPTPSQGGHRAVGAPRLYGMASWGDLFTERQKLALITLSSNIASAGISSDARYIAGLALSRLSDICNAFCRWESTKTQVRNLFTRHDLPMMWDFAEPNLFAEQAGDYVTTIGTMARVVERQESTPAGQVQQADATQSPLPDKSASVWFTDPPYYDSVAYADLSDFFYVWLKRALPERQLWHGSFGGGPPLTPKTAELTVTTLGERGQRKTQAFFEDGMSRAFSEGSRVLRDDGIASVVFAHKTTEGWEALLSGLVRGGWTINGSWPISTELANRLNARDTAALAASVHLVCRPRPQDAGVGDWVTVLRELPNRVGDWMERLQAEGVRGADLVFACIGPALEVFSRYKSVETAEGREVKLPEYLEKVWEVVGRAALEQVLGTAEAQARNGAAGALEEDARLTALFLWTLQSTEGGNGGSRKTKVEKTSQEGQTETEDDLDDEQVVPRGRKKKAYALIFDVVRRFAQPLGIHLPEWEGRIIETEKGVVRLLPVAERAEQLFGPQGAAAVASQLEGGPPSAREMQLPLFPQLDVVPTLRVRRKRRAAAGTEGLSDEALVPHREATTLDRVHAAMLLQRSGRTQALRVVLKDEQDRGSEFLRLANALSVLYPKASEEKRLLDAMLLAVPR